MKTRPTILLVSLLILSGATTPAAADQLRSPWSAKIPAKDKSDSPASTLGVAFDFYIGLFQRYISPVDGARCQLRPTCSQYARLSLKKHGGILGFFMSADRLMRDNGGIAKYHLSISHRNRQYYYDPVEDNDFWLYQPE